MKDNFFDKLESNYNEKNKEEIYESTLNGTEKNINFFLKLSKIIRIICFILAFMMFFAGLTALSESMEAFAICFFASIILVIGAILSTPFLEWKAYTLKNLYEINNKTRSK